MAKDPIKKDKNGKYYFRVHLGFDSAGKRVQKYRSGFNTKKEARNKYYELLLQKDDFLKDEIDTISFKEYIDSIFIPWYKNQVKSQTYENRMSIINAHFNYFNRMSIKEIKPIHVQKWQLKLSEKYKPSYVRGVQGLFSLAIDRAIVLNLIKTNPSKTIGNVKKQKTKLQFWTKEEFENVLSVIDKKDFYQHFQYVSIWLLFMTGIRIGEAMALSWDDLDFNTGILNIDKTMIYKNRNNYRYSDPKTKASKRQIVLDDDTLKLLQEWKDIQFTVIRTDKFILSYNGFPTQKHNLGRAIDRYSKQAKIHSIRTHDLRHSHASLLIELGENALIIRDRLGHEDIETTLGTYGHLYPNTNYEVASKLNGIINTNLNRNQFTSETPSNVQ